MLLSRDRSLFTTFLRFLQGQIGNKKSHLSKVNQIDGIYSITVPKLGVIAFQKMHPGTLISDTIAL